MCPIMDLKYGVNAGKKQKNHKVSIFKIGFQVWIDRKFPPYILFWNELPSPLPSTLLIILILNICWGRACISFSSYFIGEDSFDVDIFIFLLQWNNDASSSLFGNYMVTFDTYQQAYNKFLSFLRNHSLLDHKSDAFHIDKIN